MRREPKCCGKVQIFSHRKIREHNVILRNETEARPVLIDTTWHAVDSNRPEHITIRRTSAENVQKRGFTRTTWAHDRREHAALKFTGHSIQHALPVWKD